MVTCPHCGVPNVHRSRASIGERLMLLMMLHKRVRCYECMHRFSTWIFLPVKPRSTRNGNKKKGEAQKTTPTPLEIAQGTLPAPEEGVAEPPQQEQSQSGTSQAGE